MQTSALPIQTAALPMFKLQHYGEREREGEREYYTLRKLSGYYFFMNNVVFQLTHTSRTYIT